MVFRIGVDVGGTFTDFFVVDEEGRPSFHKTPTTPEDPSIGLLNGLSEVALKFIKDTPEAPVITSSRTGGYTHTNNFVLFQK